MSEYYLLITDAGKALEAAAHAIGETVKLTDFAVGDGGGAPVTPDAAQTTLVNETFRDAISSLTVSAADDSVLEAECIVPSSSGGYTIREIGILADDGTLYAVGNFADQEKPDPDSGYAASLQILADLAVSDTSDITLTVQDASYLTETQANTIYLRQDKRLSEIAGQGTDAQAEALTNLGCGTAAIADVVTSYNDVTPGRVPTVGWMGIGGPEINIADNTDIYKYFPTAKSGNYGGGGDLINTVTGGGWHGFKWQQHGGDSKYGFLIEMVGNSRMALHIYNNPTGDMTNPQNYWTNSGLMYSTGFKPTAADVGALPLTGGTVTGDIRLSTSHIFIFEENLGTTPVDFYTTSYSETSGHNPLFEVYAIKHNDATARQDLFNVTFDSASLVSGKRNSTGAQLNIFGKAVPGDYSNFDARYISNLQLGAETSVARNDDTGNNKTTAGYVITGSNSSYQDSNWEMETLYAKPVQKYINGAWVTISG